MKRHHSNKPSLNGTKMILQLYLDARWQNAKKNMYGYTCILYKTLYSDDTGALNPFRVCIAFEMFVVIFNTYTSSL